MASARGAGGRLGLIHPGHLGVRCLRSVDACQLADLPDDPTAYELRAHDLEPDEEEHDSLEERLATRSTRWTLDLNDPYAWLDELPQAGDAVA